MYIISLLQGMVFYAPIATLYRTAQGLSVFQITLTESIFFILCLLMEIPWGIIADKIGYKKTMILCCILYVISKIIFWRADGFMLFLLERILLGIIFAGLSGVDTSILYMSCKEGESQKIFGIYNALGTIGLLASSAVYSLFVGENFRLAGALTVVSYGLAMLMSFFLKEVKIRDKYKINLNETKMIALDMVKNKNLMILLVSVALLSETHHIVTVFLNQVQYEKCGMTASYMGYVYIVATLVGLCGVFSVWFTKKLGEMKSGSFLFLLSGIACLFLAFTGKAGISIGSILLLQAANSMFQPLQLDLQNKRIRTDKRATALSMNAMLVDCISVGINLFFGYLAGISLGITFIFGFLLCFIGLILFAQCFKMRSDLIH